MPFVPFEFTVQGPPVSLQARNRARLRTWKTTVRAAAAARWNNRQPPTAESLEFCLIYFYDQTPIGDIDNIIKPIQDALVGLVYQDDSQITDIQCQRRESHLPFVFHQISDTLLNGFMLHDDFLFIRVTEAPNPMILII